VEVAIVIVIIGILVAGVLGGQELVEQSKIKALSSQLEGYSAAANIFRIKYGYLPGDLPRSRASPYGLTSPHVDYSAIPDGNGRYNYIVPLTSCQSGFSTHSTSILGEPQFFFIHLIDAKLIKEPTLTSYGGGFVRIGTHLPFSSYGGGGIGIATLCSNRHAFVIGVQTSATVGAHNFGTGGILQGSVNAEQASMYDLKFDDGIPARGTILSIRSGPYLNTGSSFNSCVTDGTGMVYNITNTSTACSLSIEGKF